MVTNDTGCYYGVHFGCLCAARDPNCRRCAERLTNAVNYTFNQLLAPSTHRAWKMRRVDAATELHGKKGKSVLAR